MKIENHGLRTVEFIDIDTTDMGGERIYIRLKNGRQIEIAPENDGFGIMPAEHEKDRADHPLVWVTGYVSGKMAEEPSPYGETFDVGVGEKVSAKVFSF